MASLSMKGTDGVIYPIDDIVVKYPGNYYTSTRQPVSKGKWYYEFTHVSGRNGHIVGFSSSAGRIGIYAKLMLPNSVLYSTFPTSINSHEKLGFTTILDNSTIGIGLDIDNKNIYFRSSYEIRVVSWSIETMNFNIFTKEADIAGASDTLSFNFGLKPFHFGLPPGFTSWCRYPHPKSNCAINPGYFHLLVPLFMVFLISASKLEIKF